MLNLRLAFICFAAVALFSCAGSRRFCLLENPKVAAYWTSPTMSMDQADSLARFHLVIADMENMLNNHSSLARLKELNPAIKLLCYSNPMELFESKNLKDRDFQKRISDIVNNERSQYWLKQPDGEPVVFWNGMKMLNLSTLCPVVEGESYSQFVSGFLLKYVLVDRIWDGSFTDNSGGHIFWVGGRDKNRGIDADNNGIADDQATLDQAWHDGILEYLQTIRQAKGKNFILIGNKGSLDYTADSLLNGKMFEEFPNNYLGDKEADGWYQCLSNYEKTGPYTIIHAKRGKEQRLFILCSALMGDGYFAYAQNNYRYYPEYRRDLGKALGPATREGNVFKREFVKATVSVWPEEKMGEIKYK